jgi:hypothetical protein
MKLFQLQRMWAAEWEAEGNAGMWRIGLLIFRRFTVSLFLRPEKNNDLCQFWGQVSWPRFEHGDFWVRSSCWSLSTEVALGKNEGMAFHIYLIRVNDAVSNWDYVAYNDWMILNNYLYMMWKDAGVSNLRYYYIFLEGLNDTADNIRIVNVKTEIRT